MSQPIGVANNVQPNTSFTKCIGAAALVGLVFKSDLPRYACWGIYYTTLAQLSALKAVIVKFPSLLIGGGIALAVNQLISTLSPALSASTLPALAGSIKVAQFVAAFFGLGAYLTPFINGAFGDDQRLPTELYQKSVQFLCPLTISLFVADYFNFQIKLVQSAVLTGGIFILVQILTNRFQNTLGNSSTATYETVSSKKPFFLFNESKFSDFDKPEEESSEEELDKNTLDAVLKDVTVEDGYDPISYRRTESSS